MPRIRAKSWGPGSYRYPSWKNSTVWKGAKPRKLGQDGRYFDDSCSYPAWVQTARVRDKAEHRRAKPVSIAGPSANRAAKHWRAGRSW
ncbi:MAG TPA: hypothetical protein VHV83_02515 [Armatimonadota bacterium]|nr:hypothetical protein [Armatimonadota bacterium]